MEQSNNQNFAFSFSFINIFILFLFAVVVGVISSLTTYSLLSPKLFNQLPSESQSSALPFGRQVIPQTQQAVLPTSSSVDETAGWKTYTNSSFQFKIQYPPQLTPQKGEFPDDVILNDETGKKKIYIYVWPPTDEGFLNRLCDSNSEFECNITTINGYRAAKRTKKGNTQKEAHIQLSRNETIAISTTEISKPEDQSFFTVFEQIISTFSSTK